MVDKAVVLESTMHQQKKRQAEGQWLVQMANEADIELDKNFVRENKKALESYQEPARKKKEQASIKMIQREYEQEFQRADMGKFSKSCFLSPELVSQLNQIASQSPQPLAKEKQSKRWKKMKEKNMKKTNKQTAKNKQQK